MQTVTLLYFFGCPTYSFVSRILSTLFVNSVGPLTREEPTDRDSTYQAKGNACQACDLPYLKKGQGRENDKKEVIGQT